MPLRFLLRTALALLLPLLLALGMAAVTRL